MKNLFLFLITIFVSCFISASEKEFIIPSSNYDKITIIISQDFSYYEIKIPSLLFNDSFVEFDIRLNYHPVIIRWNNQKFLSEKPLIRKEGNFVYLRKNILLKEGDFLSVNCFKNSVPQKRIEKEVKRVRYDLSKLKVERDYHSYTLKIPQEAFEDNTVDISSLMSHKKAFTRIHGEWVGKPPKIIKKAPYVYLKKIIPLKDGDLIEVYLNQQSKLLYQLQRYVTRNDISSELHHKRYKFYVKNNFLYVKTRKNILSVVGYSLTGYKNKILPFRHLSKEKLLIDLSALQSNGVFIIIILSKSGKQTIKIVR